MNERVAQLEAQVALLLKWQQQRTRQQIATPLDLASQNILSESLGDIGSRGAGSTTKTQTYTDSRGDTVIAPKAYTGTWKFILPGNIAHEFPYIA